MDVFAALHRKGCQLQAGDPAFCARLHGGKIVGRERQSHRFVQKSGDLGLCKAQLLGPDIQELVADPQAGKRERGIGPGEERQVHLGRQMFQEIKEDFQYGFGIE